MTSMDRGLRMLLEIGALAVCLLIGAAYGSAAEEQSAGRPAKTADDGGRGPAFLQDLDLSPEQMAKLRENRLQNRRESIRTEAEIKTLQVDLQEELSQEAPDQTKVDQIAKQLGAAEARRVKLRAGHIVFLRSILTPEQLKKLELGMMRDEDQGGRHGGRRGGSARPKNDESGQGPEGPQ